MSDDDWVYNDDANFDVDYNEFIDDDDGLEAELEKAGGKEIEEKDRKKVKANKKQKPKPA